MILFDIIANACRAKLLRVMKRFATPNDAEKYYFTELQITSRAKESGNNYE